MVSGVEELDRDVVEENVPLSQSHCFDNNVLRLFAIRGPRQASRFRNVHVIIEILVG